jgi:DNA helicase IV
VSGVEVQREIHPELTQEQSYLERAYRCLDRMQGRAEYLKDLGYLGGNVTEGGVDPHDRQQWDRDKQRRVDLLSAQAGPLCFGRIDRPGGPRWYVGRRHVEDDAGEPVVTDWRAPVSIPFYRATVADTMGLSLRRRFLVEEGQIVDILDENLAHPSAVDAGAYVPDPLLAEIGRARTGEMRDIVATIQAEQDLIIRAPLDSCIIVQGGPGTGKTAVGLHRAAFLLYEHRQALERQQLLIVGPNRIFLRYISQVLPSLGEEASIQVTIEGLAGVRYRPGQPDPPAAARVKGDGRMAEVVRRAVFDRVTPPSEDVRIATSFGSVTLTTSDVRAVIRSTLERTRRASDGRQAVKEQLIRLAWTIHAAKLTTDITQQSVFEADVRSSATLKTLLDRAWPTVTASEAIRRLYGNRPARRRATAGILTQHESDSLARPPARTTREQRWTRADLALLDEAEALISGVRQTYGHIVVDEVQDLSPMDLRMIARRSRQGSMTLLGDLAQATAPAAQTDWRRARDDLNAPSARLEELTVGYRVPEPIMAFANRLLPYAAPGLRPPLSVRRRGDPPSVTAVPAPDLAAAVVAEVSALAERWSTTGVVVPDSLREDMVAALAESAVSFVDGLKAVALGEHVTLLPPPATKGLEFDAVVVVEPGRIVEEADGDLRLLYVVLTRAVQQLSVVHAGPLPTVLTHRSG